ncbi:MAG: hypothetical protein K6F17_03085 [Lachnospiraceae bacterium]|nr:hypothetical protein [Lachnospiraceae bacterium]
MIQTEYGMIPSVVKKEVREEYIKALSISQDDDNPEKFMEFMFNHHQNNLELYMSEYKDSLENDRLDFEI